MHEWWLEDNDTRLRITTRGLLIGRGTQCDIGVRDPRVSRRHLLVRLDPEEPVLELVGRTWARINDRAVRAYERQPLVAGDRIAIPGRELCVRQAEVAAAPASGPGFLLDHADGLYAIHAFPFVVGGAAGDDLVIPGWPAGALCLLSGRDSLVVETRCEVALASGQQLGHGDIAALEHGDALVIEGKRLGVLRRAPLDQTATVDARKDEAPLAACLERLPGCGGRLVLTFPDGEIEAMLAERRFDLVHGLLCPPEGHAPGDWIGDELLAAVVWPRDPGKGRVDLNILLSRVRRDLDKHGVKGQAVIQRARGSTRFGLAPGARVVAGDAGC